MRKTKTFLSIAGLIALLIVLPTWSYVSAAPTFKRVSGGVDVIFRNGFELPGCSAPGRMMRATVAYPPHLATRNNVDLTQWNNIWGHASATDGITPWPGVPGASPIIRAMPRDGYIAAKFTVPPGTRAQGFYKNVSNFGGLSIDVAVSKECGDFRPAQPGCIKLDTSPSDTTAMYWRMENPTAFHCAFDAPGEYYINIRNHDARESNGNCAASRPRCDVHVLNNVTGDVL